MTAAERFDAAHSAWSAERAADVAGSFALADVSSSVTHLQTTIAPAMAAYRHDRSIAPPPVKSGWYDGMSYLLMKDIRTIRRVQESGRQQVATRDLLHRALLLKEVWSANRAAIDR